METTIAERNDADAYLALSAQLEARAAGFAGFVWDQGAREFLVSTAASMRAWVDAVRSSSSLGSLRSLLTDLPSMAPEGTPVHDRPLVSVIVPSFNQGRFIGETIASTLAQDYRPIEVLILDGGSTDETLGVLEGFSGAPELEVRSEPDEGVVDAVNKGLQRARGEILAIQSSDDVYLPGAIAAAVEALRDHPEAGIVFGDVEHIDDRSRVTGRDVLPAFSLAEYLGRLTYIPQASAFFRAAAAREVGGWRAEVGYVADADYWIRMALRYPVVKIDRTMARYRYHPGQRDKHVARILGDWERMIADLQRDSRMSPKLARFARMGVHLAHYRYTPEADWPARMRHLYRAALANPGAIAHRFFPKRELIPGRTPVWAALSRMKRALGLQPRGK